MTSSALRALDARIRVLLEFDRQRARLPFDTTANRRQRAIRRLEDAYAAGKRERRLDLLLEPGDVDALADHLEATREDLARAFAAECSHRLTRNITDSVVLALENTGRALNLTPPAVLDRALKGDGITIKRSGGSRRRRTR